MGYIFLFTSQSLVHARLLVQLSELFPTRPTKMLLPDYIVNEFQVNLLLLKRNKYSLQDLTQINDQGKLHKSLQNSISA